MCLILLPLFCDSRTNFGDRFNWASRKLYKRFSQLGASEIYPRAESDEQHPEGLDATFLPWTVDLKKHLLDMYPLEEGKSPIPEDVFLQPKWVLDPVMENGHSNSEANGSKPAECGPHLPNTDLLPIPSAVSATLERNERITPEKHWQDVRLMTLTTEEHLPYAPGDILSIFPKNFPNDVQQLIDLMDWTSVADTPMTLIRYGVIQDPKEKLMQPIPNMQPHQTVSLRSLLSNYLDITAIPRRSFFNTIAHFTNDEMHKERLLEFTNPEFIDELYDYTTRPRRSILEVLQEFESVKIPFQWIVAVFPLLRRRQFSIASGGALKRTSDGRTRFQLLVAIVKYRTVIKKIREGVCTRYLATLPEGTRMNVLLEKGSLKMPAHGASSPVVMVGPGTGVAPLRSMIWERRAIAEMGRQVIANGNGSAVTNGNDQAPEVGKTVLFFGGRNRSSDYFFGEEWEDIKGSLDLKCITAFSRDQRQKIYVQDEIRAKSALLYRLLLEQTGSVYVCGSSGKMPQAVREALIEIFQQEGSMERDAAEAYLTKMEKSGRYVQETWS